MVTPNFQVDDCATQRNLDQRGREQSKQIGDVFKSPDFATDTVHSNPWCRCLETARLMDIGEVESFEGLGSFFEPRRPAGNTQTSLGQAVNDLRS